MGLLSRIRGRLRHSGTQADNPSEKVWGLIGEWPIYSDMYIYSPPEADESVTTATSPDIKPKKGAA
jgi:hypothetical protein